MSVEKYIKEAERIYTKYYPLFSDVKNTVLRYDRYIKFNITAPIAYMDKTDVVVFPNVTPDYCSQAAEISRCVNQLKKVETPQRAVTYAHKVEKTTIG